MPLLERDKNITCITCSEVPLYIYQIMRPNTRPKNACQRTDSAAETPVQQVFTPLTETRAEAAKVGNTYVLNKMHTLIYLAAAYT